VLFAAIMFLFLLRTLFKFRLTSPKINMKLLQQIPPLIRNKFVLATLSFVVWMLFFDRNDLFTQIERQGELNELKQSKQYFEKQIAENRKFSKDLQFNASTIEKYARERYLMKRDNEDLFIIQPLEKK
jgi:cell division protein DivIC